MGLNICMWNRSSTFFPVHFLILQNHAIYLLFFLFFLALCYAAVYIFVLFIQNGSNRYQTATFLQIQFKKFFLDEEWHYAPKQTNKSNVPVFIKKFYEQRLKEPNNTDTVRIFFNMNRNSSSTIIKFDLSSLKIENENVTDADMYFYWPLDNSSRYWKSKKSSLSHALFISDLNIGVFSVS